MKKEKIILASLLIVSLLAMISASGAATDRMPGVNVGDVFTYGNLSFNWYSNDTSATPPTEWQGLNQTEWIRISVGNVVVKNVTCNLQAHYKNGTEETGSGWIDVDTGDNLNMTWFFIAANLNSGDSIYSSGSYSTWMINETIQKMYDGVPRDANHINMTIEESNPPPYYYYVYASQNFYWDRETGALIEMSIYVNQTFTLSTTEYSISIELTGSNVWVVPEFIGLPQTLLLIASLALVTLASRRKLPKTRNH